MLIESASKLRKALHVHLPTIKSLDPLPKERDKTRDFRRTLIGKFGTACCLCLRITGAADIEAAHIVPLQLGAQTTESNLVLLCSACHGMYDSGYLSIAAMKDIHAAWASCARDTPIDLSAIAVPIRSAAMTAPPEALKQVLEDIRQMQVKAKPAAACRMAVAELGKHHEASVEHARMRIKVAELMRRRAAQGTLEKSLAILESIDISALDPLSHPLYFYELNYVYRLSGRHRKALKVIEKSASATAPNVAENDLKLEYIAAEANALLCRFAEIDHPSDAEGRQFVEQFERLAKAAYGHGQYWGGRWAMNCEAHIVQVHIKCADAQASRNSLHRLKSIFHSSDVTNGWDLGSRNSLSQLDGVVHVLFSRNSEEIRRGVGILARSFASRIGTRLRPEGVRDVGYALARGLRVLDAASYSKVANAIDEAMHVTLDGTSYIWPYKADAHS